MRKDLYHISKFLKDRNRVTVAPCLEGVEAQCHRPTPPKPYSVPCFMLMASHR